MTNKIDSEVSPREQPDAAGGQAMDRPTAEELLAYHRGELSAADADRIQEILARDPESAETLLDLAVHPYSGQPGDADYLSEKELADDWQQLQDRIRQEEEGGARVLPFPSRRWFPWGVAAAAAVVAIAVGLRSFDLQDQMAILAEKVDALEETSRELKQPLAVFKRFTLLPEGGRGTPGDAPPPTLVGPSAALLTLSVLPHPPYSDYRIDIVSASATATDPPAWSLAGLRPLKSGDFEVWLPQDCVPPGVYQLRLFGVGETEKLLAQYSLRF